MLRTFSISVLILALGGCNTVANLHYVPSAPLQLGSAPAIISAVSVTDQRKEAPTRLATIMGGFGNPLKTLDTEKPVKDEVASVFTEGLRARGMLAPDGQAPFNIALVVHKFDADMIMGRTARIDLTMVVVDKQGRAVYQDSAKDSQSNFKFFETGMFADIADLQTLSETLLDRTVDHMLDAPGFRTAVAGIPSVQAQAR